MSPRDSNIILTGFMGTGKTSVGQALSCALGWPFVDLDDVIETHAGCSISEVFERKGEESFRKLETEACQEVAQRKSVVIATGGGTIVQPSNRAILERTGILICLTASPQQILERVGTETHRPLLESTSESRSERISSLLAARAPQYNAVGLQVDTTHLDIAGVVSEIRKCLEL